MGCLCCKPSAIEDRKESPRDRLSRKPSTDLRNSRQYFPRRDESHRAKDKYSSGNDERLISADNLSNGSLRLVVENHIRSQERMGHAVAPHSVVGTIPEATEGQQIAAGWPPWLVALAGEAIKGWLPHRADSFEKLDKMLKDHDRHIQEAFRRARIDKAKASKTQVEGNQIIAGSLFISGR